MKPSFLKKFERPLYGEGQIILADDLNAAQNYFRRKIELLNRNLFGACIHEGLEVRKTSNGYVVSPGLAYDCRGRELVVDEPTTVEMSEPEGDEQYVLLQYNERQTPNPAPDSLPQSSLAVRIVEDVRVYTGPTSLLETHEQTSRGWRACNACESLPIALIRNGRVERVIPEGAD